MTKEPILDVLRLQRFAQKRIRAKIDHARGQIVAGAPVRIRFSQFIGRKRRWDFSCAGHGCSPGIQSAGVALRDALYSLNCSDEIQMNFRANPRPSCRGGLVTRKTESNRASCEPFGQTLTSRITSFCFVFAGSTLSLPGLSGNGLMGRAEPGFPMGLSTNKGDRRSPQFR